MSEEYDVYVGIDWGTQRHRVWVTDATGKCLGDREVPHTGVALIELADWLVHIANGRADTVAVLLEAPRGAIVDVLLERGCHVFAINPKQLARVRDRYSAAGAKADRRDARVLANVARTDRPATRRLAVDDPTTIRLREYVRQDTELAEDVQRVANRLRDHLVRVWPELLTLVPNADEAWFWTLLEWVPTPTAAATVRPARIRQLLREHRIRRLTADEVLAVVRQASVRLAPGVREGVAVRVQDGIEQLRIVSAQRRKAARRLTETLDALAAEPAAEKHREHADVTILQSLPGIGTRIAATMLAEAPQAVRDRDYHALRALGGAPVTKQSGKTRVVRMRRACNHALRRAFYFWGENSVRVDALSRAHYDQLRARGHGHPRAVRGVVDRLLDVLTQMLLTNTLYDAKRRRAWAHSAATMTPAACEA